MQFLIPSTVLPVLAHGAFTVLSDAIPQLTNLTLSSPSRYLPQLGGMNMTHCCLLALNSSFVIRDGNLSISDTSFISADTTPASFLAAISNGQCPCGATFNGELSGAPPITSTYRWCKSNCSGWQISQVKKLQQWIGPMVGFILPALVFCLNIPRRRTLEVRDQLFQSQSGSRCNFLLTPMRLLVAVIIVSTDTLLWLALCFAFAAPMILSGVYEAFLDHRILKFLIKDGSKLNVESRARLLYIILVGNLDLQGNQTLPDFDEGGPWEDVNEMISEFREVLRRASHVDESIGPKDHGSIEGAQEGVEMSLRPSATSQVAFRKVSDDVTARIHLAKEAVSETRTRLLSILRTQSGFGPAVGAPIVFFAGGFAYTIADTMSHLGDNDTAHALAFGMWWMIIPHVAIISSLLLASNNPSAFEAIVGRPLVEHPPVFKVFALAYPSRYKTE